jgi:molecular chaperone DnaK
VRPVIERCRHPVQQALADAGITPVQIDRVVFVGGPTRMPMVRQFFEDLLQRKAEMGVDPMECVAGGAAVQAGVLSGEVKDIVLVDVTPLTLGVETLGGVATPLITRNTPVPVKKSEIFTTAADMQTSVTIHVFQGERPMSADNTSLGEFNLDGLAPAPRGMPKIEVTFDIDASGILNVAARDSATGRAQSIRISGSTRLAEDVKKRMIDEAERYAEADRKRREDADTFNAADSMCYQAEKTVADFGDKLTEELKGRIEAARREVREALAKKDAAAAKDKAEALGKLLKEAGAVVYAQRPDAGVYRETKVPSGARVVDADYRESR